MLTNNSQRPIQAHYHSQHQPPHVCYQPQLQLQPVQSQSQPPLNQELIQTQNHSNSSKYTLLPPIKHNSTRPSSHTWKLQSQTDIQRTKQQIQAHPSVLQIPTQMISCYTFLLSIHAYKAAQELTSHTTNTRLARYFHLTLLIHTKAFSDAIKHAQYLFTLSTNLKRRVRSGKRR